MTRQDSRRIVIVLDVHLICSGRSSYLRGGLLLNAPPTTCGTTHSLDRYDILGSILAHEIGHLLLQEASPIRRKASCEPTGATSDLREDRPWRDSLRPEAGPSDGEGRARQSADGHRAVREESRNQNAELPRGFRAVMACSWLSIPHAVAVLRLG